METNKIEEALNQLFPTEGMGKIFQPEVKPSTIFTNSPRYIFPGSPSPRVRGYRFEGRQWSLPKN